MIHYICNIIHYLYYTSYNIVRTTEHIGDTVFWDVTPHNRGETRCLHLQGRILNMEAARSSEKLVTFYQPTWHQSQSLQSPWQEHDVLQTDLINLLDQKH
jgi:hypothetical protein